MGLKALDPFMTTLQTTDEWMEDVIEELGPKDPTKAQRALRAVLHALRDRMLPGEIADFASELPMLLRGLYYEGWNAGGDMPERSREAFLEDVTDKLQAPADPDAEHCTRAIFAVLQQRISAGEISDVQAHLPDEVTALWPD